MMEKLKACPFCGSTNVEISPYGGAKAVACMDCFCRSEIFEGENAKEKAIAAWNRRAAPESKPLTCEGCAYKGKYEAEYEYGYPSSCTACKRRAADNYVRRPEGAPSEGSDKS